MLQILVTGMHLSKKHGSTYKLIEKDGFKIDRKIKMDNTDDTNSAMAKSLGDGIKGLSTAVDELDPDIVLVLGDRSEALSGALVGVYLNKIVAHIHGGEVTKGCIDESIRHAITKLAHIHFPATEDSAKRIERMGERTENIHVVGAPGLDVIKNKYFTPEYEIRNKYNLPIDKPLILVIQHSVTQETHKAKTQIQITLEALLEVEANIILIYPNNDAGGQAIIEKIESAKLPENFRTYVNIPREDYLGLMSIATALVGNSSSGIIEAPSFRLPVVNIGIRQMGRQRAENIIDVPNIKEAIIQAIKQILFDKAYRNKLSNLKNPYGDGKTSERIAKILEELEINEELLQKQITY